MKKEIIVKGIKFTIVHPPAEGQVAYRVLTDTGWTPLHRLKDSYGKRIVLNNGYKTVEEMGIEFFTYCHVAVTNHITQIMHNESFKMPCRKMKTCRQAMEEFERERNRDSHGNAFKDYFGDTFISKLNRKITAEWVGYLMDKYNRNEQTVKHKVHAASALFRWLKQQGFWAGENPFCDLLNGLKFADPKELRDNIETEELKSIYNALSKPQYRDLRILFEILYCTGMRPSEAIKVKWEDIDKDELILTYWRSKRKYNSPDKRRIPIPSRLVAFLTNENAISGRLVKAGVGQLQRQMRKVSEESHAGGISLKTVRKDWAYRASLYGHASTDEINLMQGRDEGTLERHYLTNPFFIVKTCRPLIERMYGTASIQRVK